MKIILTLSIGLLLASGEEILTEYRDGNIKFTSDIYKELSKSTSGNILMCPLSMEIVIAMVFAGARGETARQLSLAASLPNDPDKVVDMFSKIIPHLESSDKYTFESADKIYIKNKFGVAETYKELVKNKFNSEIENIDFMNPNAALEMNKWVEKKTHNKIRELIDQKDLNDDSRMMILNAMYFKGQWVKEFENTRAKPFFVNNTHYINTDMMSNKGKYKYYEDDKLNAKFLEIPYKGDDVAMIVALPNNPEDIHTLENNMDQVLAPKFQQPTKINIKIPKFEVEDSIKFKEILKSLGAVLPFEDGATFDGMLSAEEHEALKIANIIQKTAIEVDEKGSVAAASTVAQMENWRSAKILPDLYFYADHPFIYFIKHKIAGITFIGRYSAPKGTIESGKYEAPFDPEFAANLINPIPVHD